MTQKHTSKNIPAYFHIDGKQFTCIMNASGCCSRYREQLDELVAGGMTTIITKSCTLYENLGNPYPNFKKLNAHISINCLGMPNCGFYYYRNLLPSYYMNGITYIISMDASNWNELKMMLLEYDKFIYNMKSKLGIKDNIREFVEINASCPNKLDVNTGTTSRIIAYAPIELSRLLENIKGLNLININIGLKLSPYVDKVLLEQIANVLITYSSIVRYIVCGNSIPNGMIINLQTKQPLLSVNTGGISGTANRLLGISNVYHFNNIFHSRDSNNPIVIIGCGGIETEDDILEYLCAGAQCVQIGRVLYISGVEKCIEINNNLLAKL